MYDVFTSQTGTIFGKEFPSVELAEKYALTLGIEAQIFKVGDPFTVVKNVFPIRFEDVDQSVLDAEDLLDRYPNSIEQLDILKKDYLGIEVDK